MPISLVRIDDRLVHGQVVEGWLPAIEADRVLVVSDEAAGDATQSALMRLALPEEVGLDVVEPDDAAAALERAEAAEEKVLVLAPGPAEVLALLENGVEFATVNVGGLHYAAGHVQLGKAIFLSPDDMRALEAIADRGVRLEGRAVPADAPEDVIELIRARD
jgi:PTS system mannose-specific IIA component